MKINRNEFVAAFSFTLDFLEKGFRERVTNHGKRVCLIALNLGEAFGFTDEDLFDLFAYAALHDNGITNEVYNVLSQNGVDRLESALSHCIKGEENLKKFPFLKQRDSVLKYHHEAYDGSGFFGISGGEIPLFSQIIALADMIEIMYQNGAGREDIISAVAKLKGSKISPALGEAFEYLAKGVSCWLSLEDMFIDNELKRRVHTYYIDLEFQDLLPVSEIMRSIIDAKSPFTATHSDGLAQKAAVMADFYGFDAEKKIKLVIAANLHDVGKLVIPNSIIDKPGKLTPEEFNIIKAHTFYTRKVLESVNGFEDITEWASNHHEKLDGNGYPYALPASRLDFESRLMACLDIYQALTENRPYRDGMPHSKACEILDGMGQKGYIESQIASDVKERFAV